MKIRNLVVIMVFLLLVLVAGCSSKQIGDYSIFSDGFNGADGITFDHKGNMYVGNRYTNVISKVSREGEASDFVTVPCEELLLMTTDKLGNIYAAGGDKVFKITPLGVITELADDFGCADDLRFDLNGNLYVTDSYRNIVYKITPKLEKTIFIDSDLSSVGNRKWHITGIAFSPDYQYLYIARMERGEIVRYPIKSNGEAGAPEIFIDNIDLPDHIDVDRSGNLYVTLFSEGSLVKIDKSGNLEMICDGIMKNATGIAIGKGIINGRYAYVADMGNNRIYRIYIG